MILVFLMAGHETQGLDLPVATSGFEQWAGVIGDALAYGGKSKEDTLQALKGFQAVVMEHLKKQVGFTYSVLFLPHS